MIHFTCLVAHSQFDSPQLRYVSGNAEIMRIHHFHGTHLPYSQNSVCVLILNGQAGTRI